MLVNSYKKQYSLPFLGVSADGKVDRPTWKAIQQVMNDSQKFVESLHHVPWKEGLPEDILKGVQSFLAASNGGDVSESDLGAAAPGASASTYQSSPGRGSVTAGTVFVISSNNSDNDRNAFLLRDIIKIRL